MSGFLSTLASYLTSTAKSEPKPVPIQKKHLMTSWDDVDFVKLNMLVCNILYEQNSYEPLITEIERVVGRRREHCFYGVLSAAVVLILLHDAIGAMTAFMTLIIPTFMTVTAISSSLEKEYQDFSIRYWTVYAVFVTIESFLSSLIQWDLRLFRLIFMSSCLSTRIPVLAAVHGL
uniref:Receptor expression-enhancing protein n=1 Tax=Caenorhabditis tropicalis TaxID=1561998 RepID=A0A1I7UQH8_9PELO